MQFLTQYKDSITTATGAIIPIATAILSGMLPAPESVKAFAMVIFSLAAFVQGLLIGKYPKLGG